MNLTLLPTKALGKWSVGLVIVALLCFAAFIIEVAMGMRGGDRLDLTDPSQLWPAMPMLLAGFFVVSSMVTGVVGIVKSKERSVLVFMAAALGLFVILLVVGEFLFPH